VGLMEVGDSGYIVPWNVVVDSHHQAYIHAAALLYPAPIEYAYIPVQRLADGVHLWTAEATRLKQFWTPTPEIDYPSVVPVARIHPEDDVEFPARS
jgi:hypothetical protein